MADTIMVKQFKTKYHIRQSALTRIFSHWDNGFSNNIIK